MTSNSKEIRQLLDMAAQFIREGRLAEAVTLINVSANMLPNGNVVDDDTRRRKMESIKPTDYSGIEKWAAIQLYLDGVGHPVTFRELVQAMRKGGMQLPADDGNAHRVLAIVVKQNSGFDGKRDWPARFYREGESKDVTAKVGLLLWKQKEVESKAG